MIRWLKVRGLLSFGSTLQQLELRPLNVLVGPNGSGKSNLIECLALMRASPTKLSAPIMNPRGGGIIEWLWKGAPEGQAFIELTAAVPSAGESLVLHHSITIRSNSASRFELRQEDIIEDTCTDGEQRQGTVYTYGRERGGSFDFFEAPDRRLSADEMAPDESVLSQYKDPQRLPKLAALSRFYGDIRIYRNWPFGPASPLRTPPRADLSDAKLDEDFSNLALVLNRLRQDPAVRKRLVEALREIYEGAEDFGITVSSGLVQLHVIEGGYTIPASRLSDGTLRYMALLAILLDPKPPAVTCIEEPEVGLHPDLLPRLASLMADASERTQLIVTTHSDILIDAFTESPECVLVFEKGDTGTSVRRLNQPELREWLKEYRLGELWMKGELGGTRW